MLGQEGLLKAFIDHSKKSQQQRDSKKIEELEGKGQSMGEKYAKLQKQYTLMKEQLERQNQQLRMQNIKLDSQNKAIKLKNDMYENIVKMTHNNNDIFHPNELATYRIVMEENKQLKELIKLQITRK